jgi:hypothetical protein
MMKKEKGMYAKKGTAKKMANKKASATKSGNGLTSAQKKLPPALQKAIMNRKKKK